MDIGKDLQNAYNDGYADAKANVAREIFEDINAIKKEYASGNIDGNELYVRLYMLEKKFTEGKTWSNRANVIAQIGLKIAPLTA